MKWQYKMAVLPGAEFWSNKTIVNEKLESALNCFGEDGWEIASAVATQTVVHDVVVIPKRPKTS